MTLRKSLVTWAFALVCAAGCADEPGGSAASIAVLPTTERWSLTSVDGQPLPMSMVQTAGVTREVSAGRLSLEGDWTWTFRFDHHDTGAALDREASSGLTGSYSVYGGEPTVMLLRNEGERATYTATVTAGAALVLTVDGHRYGFAKAQ